MKVKNEKFFKNKTYAQIFSELDFKAHLKRLEKKFKNKKIIIYGAGIMFDFIVDNFDLSKFNIVAVADKKFESDLIKEYKGFKAIVPFEIQAQDGDLILIAHNYPVKILQSLKQSYKNLPPVYFWLNKPFSVYFEEIFM